MNIQLIVIGKTDDKCILELISRYEKRIRSYNNFEMSVLPDIKNNKNLSPEQQKQKEGSIILSKLSLSDYVILLDETGKEFTSESFSQFLQKRMNTGLKKLVFVIGGPYGFSQQVYQRANQKVSLSQMTFSHQLVRVVFMEQLYRAFTILHNHPYHHS